MLDLYCGAGGAAMGYHKAGFEVVGVDLNPQHRFPFEFHQADAIQVLEQEAEWIRAGFDAIHASPPCQHYANVTSWRGNPDAHPDLIAPTRALLEATGLPWVIENVPEAPVRQDYLLCGTMFHLPIRRHRAFETNWPSQGAPGPCSHQPSDKPFMHKQERAYADAMECYWMSAREGREAIPPAYTRHIGHQLLRHLTAEPPP